MCEIKILFIPSLVLSDVPRIYEDDNVDVVYTWQGMVRNMSCHSHAVPEPLIKWLRFDQILENNQTNKIFEMGRHSALQVRMSLHIWYLPKNERRIVFFRHR